MSALVLLVSGNRFQVSESEKLDRPPSPPLYAPFYFISSLIVRHTRLLGVTPDMLTVGWISLTTAAGYVLAINRTTLALPLVLFSVLLDCLDGDLARSRSRASASGSLLERVGHWWSSMALFAGAGVGVRLRYGCPTSILVLSSLIVSLAVYLAVITDVQRLEVSNRPPTKSMRALFRAIKINYYAMPIELPFAVGLSLLGLNLRLLWGTTLFLWAGTLSVFLAEFMVLRSIDHNKAQAAQLSGFPDGAVREADRLFASRTRINWYAPVPARIPPQVLRITGSQPAFSNDPFIVDVRRQLQEDLPALFRTSGSAFTLPYGPTSAIEAVTRHVIEPGDAAIVIVGGPTGRSWSKAVQANNSKVIEVNVPFGDDVDLTALEQAISRNENVKVLFAVLTESTHGALYDIPKIGQCLESRKIRFVVDCTAGLAADDFRMDEWGIDFALAGCAGGLMAPAGVSVVAVSPRTMQTVGNARLPLASRSGLSPLIDTCSLFSEACDSSSSHIFEPLYVSTRMILSAGVDSVVAHRQEVAKAFRRGCVDVLHLDLVPKRPSAACTTAFLPPDIRADRLLQLLADKYYIGVLSCVAPDGRETLCIGHSGWVFREDIYRVIEALALAFAELEGSGSAAKRN